MNQPMYLLVHPASGRYINSKGEETTWYNALYFSSAREAKAHRTACKAETEWAIVHVDINILGVLRESIAR